MKFGSVDNPEIIDFTLPDDNANTLKVLQSVESKDFQAYVGCAKWNKTDLKGFYPRGTKDELTYYATQFNSIELNATFYRDFGFDQMQKWSEKTPDNFKFFPKIPQMISHIRRLDGVDEMVKDFCYSTSGFGSKLGMLFLQLHDNFGLKNFERLEEFVGKFPKNIPLAIELRNTEWFNNVEASAKLYALMETNNIANIITDTAGRRDLLHMRLTSKTAFIRYVGANHVSDYYRLDEWVKRIVSWKEAGLENLYFFVHQNVEVESPLLSAHFIEKLNAAIGTELKIPNK